MDPNSQNQMWSHWTFEVFDAGRLVPQADVEYNAAKWLRLGFGSATACRVKPTNTGWIIEAKTEGRPAHDWAYVASVGHGFKAFVQKGWGPLALGKVKVKVLAGSLQDGKPAEQWVEGPARIEGEQHGSSIPGR